MLPSALVIIGFDIKKAKLFCDSCTLFALITNARIIMKAY
jgi:hypothetical protein